MTEINNDVATAENSAPDTADVAGGENLPPETEAPKGNREARYRTERNEYREQVATLSARVEQFQTKELLREAGAYLSAPADLLALGDVTIADLLDDVGDVDPDKVAAAALAVLAARPGLSKTQPAYDPYQGHGGGGKPKVGWNDFLKT